MKDKGLGNTGPHDQGESDVWTSPPAITSLSRRLQPRNAGFRTARHRNTARLRAKARGLKPKNHNVFPTLAWQPCKGLSGSDELHSAVVSAM